MIHSLRETVLESGATSFQHGVEFQLLEEMDNILLHGFVHEQVQKQRSE